MHRTHRAELLHLQGSISRAIGVSLALAVTAGCPAMGQLITLDPISPEALQAATTRAGCVLALPRFETNSAAIHQSVRRTLQLLETRLGTIGRTRDRAPSFQTAAVALDDALFERLVLENRLTLLRELGPGPDLQDAAAAGLARLREWQLKNWFRPEIHLALAQLAMLAPPTDRQDARLLRELLRDSRRAGAGLSADERAKLQRDQALLAQAEHEFLRNIRRATRPVVFSQTELEGLPPSFFDLPRLKPTNGQCTVRLEVPWQYLALMGHAESESARRRADAERSQLASAANLPLLETLLRLRSRVAARLGYASWAELRLESTMAANPTNVTWLLDRVERATQPRFQQDVAHMRQLKALDSGDPAAQVYSWDWRYYATLLDTRQASRTREPATSTVVLGPTLDQLFDWCGRQLGLRFHHVVPASAWSPAIELVLVSDAVNGRPLGLVYLDLFQRPGKFAHHAEFDLVPSKLLHDGRSQRPIAVWVDSLPSPGVEGAEVRLSVDQAAGLYHEFGHVLHALLSQTRYARLSANSGSRDFVEIPAVLLELQGRRALASSPAGSLPDRGGATRLTAPEWIPGRPALAVLGDRLQLTYAWLDLALHSRVWGAGPIDLVGVSQGVFERFFPVGSSDPSGLAHLPHWVSYDAGYYSYLWAEAVAMDLIQTPGTDAADARRFRAVLLESDGSRDPNDVVRALLGRDWSPQSMLDALAVD